MYKIISYTISTVYFILYKFPYHIPTDALITPYLIFMLVYLTKALFLNVIEA